MLALFFVSLCFFLGGDLFAQSNEQKTLSNQELERRIDLLAEEMAQIKAHQTFSQKQESKYGLGQSASKVYHIPQGLSIGGYGELYYLSPRSQDESGNPAGKDPQAEVLRNILYFGYKFNEKWLVNMELEIEHVSQVFTEFLYVDYLHSEQWNARAGLMLHPVGFVNELHEPALYPSVLRPDVETLIIPTTWRSLGGGLFGTLGKIDYKLFFMNGMNAQGFSQNSNRGARKRGGHYPDGGEASDRAMKEDNLRASTGAAVFRADYNLTPQWQIGVSGLVGEASGDETNLDQTMLAGHVQWMSRQHRLRLLYVQNEFGNAEEWNALPENNTLMEKQMGVYAEYLYRILLKSGDLVPFARWEMLDLAAKRPLGVSENSELQSQVLTVGLNYFPLDRLVFKADYSIRENEAQTGVSVFALGMGFNF